MSGTFDAHPTALADKLSELYRYTPQVLRWRCDASMAARGMTILKAMGFKKPWLTSPRDFIAGVLLQNPMAYGMLCAEIILTDVMGGYTNDCWMGDGRKVNLQTWQDMQSLGLLPFSPHDIGGGFIIEFDIERIRERLRGLIQDEG